MTSRSENDSQPKSLAAWLRASHWRAVSFYSTLDLLTSIFEHPKALLLFSYYCMMAPCDLCYDLDLDRLARRVLPHYDKSRPPSELGMGLQSLDASAAGGCKICDLLRRGLTFFDSDYGSRYEEYSHVTLALEITPQSLHGTIKVMRVRWLTSSSSPNQVSLGQYLSTTSGIRMGFQDSYLPRSPSSFR